MRENVGMERLIHNCHYLWDFPFSKLLDWHLILIPYLLKAFRQVASQITCVEVYKHSAHTRSSREN